MKGIGMIKEQYGYSLLPIYKAFVRIHFDDGDIIYNQNN